jgi:hypothetical protein
VPSDYWQYLYEKSFHIQYNPDLNMDRDKLNEIARKTIAGGCFWDNPGDNKVEIGTHKGVMWMAFAIHEKNVIVVAIETRERFEKSLKVNIDTLLIDNGVPEGQHKHGAI